MIALVSLNVGWEMVGEGRGEDPESVKRDSRLWLHIIATQKNFKNIHVQAHYKFLIQLAWRWRLG